MNTNEIYLLSSFICWAFALCVAVVAFRCCKKSGTIMILALCFMAFLSVADYLRMTSGYWATYVPYFSRVKLVLSMKFCMLTYLVGVGILALKFLALLRRKNELNEVLATIQNDRKL